VFGVFVYVVCVFEGVCAVCVGCLFVRVVCVWCVCKCVVFMYV